VTSGASLIASQLDARMRELSTPGRGAKAKQYLKSDLEHYGTSVPALRKLAKPAARWLDHDQLMSLVAELWSHPVFERRLVAAILLGERNELLSAGDLAEIERMLREARTWALVDTLVPHPVGQLSERDPTGSETYLNRWAGDKDFWLRRSALLAHLVPLREGRGDWTRFTRYADQMLNEKEFFIRKAIGWILRDTSRKRPELVRDWVAPRTHLMSGVTIREAVRRLQPQDAQVLMDSYREHRPATTQTRPLA
jgi:3-methyladenine DNA glycosylase AlkD